MYSYAKYEVIGTKLITKVYSVCSQCGSEELADTIERELTPKEIARMKARKAELEQMLQEIGW